MVKEELLVVFNFCISMWHLSALVVDAANFIFVIGCTLRGIGNNNGRCSFFNSTYLNTSNLI